MYRISQSYDESLFHKFLRLSFTSRKFDCRQCEIEKEKMILSISVPSAKVPAKNRYLFTPTHLSAGGRERGGIAIWANAKTQGSFPHLARRKRRRKKQHSLTKTKLRKMFIHSQEIPHNIKKHANNNVHLPQKCVSCKKNHKTTFI